MEIDVCEMCLSKRKEELLPSHSIYRWSGPSFLLLIIITILSTLIPVEGCLEPLGIESQELPDSAFTASSESSTERGAQHARLGHLGVGWRPATVSLGEYLQVDLSQRYQSSTNDYRVTRIATQGRRGRQEYVVEFNVQYSDDNKIWASYVDRYGMVKVFQGNTDGDGIKYNDFDQPIIARYIRILPTRWNQQISLRIELYGCPYYRIMASFLGDGNLRYQLHDDDESINTDSDQIEFRMKTSTDDGIIFYAHGAQGDYLALQLIDGRLEISINLGTTRDVDGKTTMRFGSLLDDDAWHDISLIRVRRQLTINIDRVAETVTTNGDFTHLNLDIELFVGGMEYKNLPGIDIAKNFKGCLENLMVNNRNLFQRYRDGDSWFSRSGAVTLRDKCPPSHAVPITFQRPESYFLHFGHEGRREMNVTFDLRTYDEDGVLFTHTLSKDGSVKLKLFKGRLKLYLYLKFAGSFDEVIDIGNNIKVNDGLWHYISVDIRDNLITCQLDEAPSITRRRITITTGTEFYMGGGFTTEINERGFVGCMKRVAINGLTMELYNIKDFQLVDGVVIDSCGLRDRCHPSPCEHGGVCKQEWATFTCDCTDTGYTGAVCHASLNPMSCMAYFQLHPQTPRASIDVDVDGSGPLQPFTVSCIQHRDGLITTIMEHDSKGEVSVSGYEEPGSYRHVFTYSAGREQLDRFMNRSVSCEQSVKYECYHTRLLEGPQRLNPYVWWVSRMNTRMYYWGDSSPGSYSCHCGMDKSCPNPDSYCNCDGTRDGVDEGRLRDKEMLPVMELLVGNTGTLNDNKRSIFRVSELTCYGDNYYDNVVTFKYDDATLEFPTFPSRDSGDIAFQFKTTSQSGVILHNTGDGGRFIQVRLATDTQLQFQYDAGQGRKVLTVSTNFHLNDNQWHTVLIERNRKEARLQVDNFTPISLAENVEGFRELHLTSPLIIGATTTYEDGFVGCLRAFTVNGELLDLAGAARGDSNSEQDISQIDAPPPAQLLPGDQQYYPGQTYPGIYPAISAGISSQYRPAPTPVYGVLEGCHGKCQSNPCLNNGTCLEGYSKYWCDCGWTSYRGPICADEVGAMLGPEDKVRYDFEATGYLTTVDEFITVGFVTNLQQGLLMQVTTTSGDYITLEVNNNGGVKVRFKFNPSMIDDEINYDKHFLNNGQHHDVVLRRDQDGDRLILTVDNYPPFIHNLGLAKGADAKLSGLRSIFVGRNDTLSPAQGFQGCISRMRFNEFFPLKALFRQPASDHVTFESNNEQIRYSRCNIEPYTHAPELLEIRPTTPPTIPTVSPGILRSATDAIILAVVLVFILILLLVIIFLIIRFINKQKGTYVTHEAKGADRYRDPDSAIARGATGQPDVKRKEWFM